MSFQLPPIRGASPKESVTPNSVSLRDLSSATLSEVSEELFDQISEEVSSVSCERVYEVKEGISDSVAIQQLHAGLTPTLIARGSNGEVNRVVCGDKIIAEKTSYIEFGASEKEVAHALVLSPEECFQNLPKVYLVGKSKLWMELIPHSIPKTEPGMPPNFKLARKVILAICSALRDIERITGKPYVHRDLKLENMRMREDGSVVILDFGTLAVRGESGDDAQGTCGTMAHESFCGVPIHEALDSWSAGVIAYQLLTGEEHPVPDLRGPFSTPYGLMTTSIIKYGIPLLEKGQSPEAFIEENKVEAKLENWGRFNEGLRAKVAELKEHASDAEDLQTLDLMWGFLDPDNFTRLLPQEALSRVEGGLPPQLQLLLPPPVPRSKP